MRGAWVEIPTAGSKNQKRLSLPVRGAWVEILDNMFGDLGIHRSLPVRGAWVEISVLALRKEKLTSSLPVRGAWVEIAIRRLSSQVQNVAPRAGSVG